MSIYRYVTEGSFDAYMWQALETKARFISQVITGDNAARRAKDIDGQELSYAEVKAIASGNPAVLTLAEADAELQRLAILKKNHLDEQFVAQRRVRDLPSLIASLSEQLSRLTLDEFTARAHVADAVAINGRSYSAKDLPTALGEALGRLPWTVLETTRVPLGTYRGLTFGLVRRPQFAPDVYLEGRATRQTLMQRDNAGPRAIYNELERIANSYDSACADVRQDLAVAEGQLRDYRVSLGKPFAVARYIEELTTLRDELRLGLSDHAPQTGDGKRPSITTLAEQIKALRAANHLDAAPDRMRPAKPTIKTIAENLSAPSPKIFGSVSAAAIPERPLNGVILSVPPIGESARSLA